MAQASSEGGSYELDLLPVYQAPSEVPPAGGYLSNSSSRQGRTVTETAQKRLQSSFSPSRAGSRSPWNLACRRSRGTSYNPACFPVRLASPAFPEGFPQGLPPVTCFEIFCSPNPHLLVFGDQEKMRAHRGLHIRFLSACLLWGWSEVLLVRSAPSIRAPSSLKGILVWKADLSSGKPSLHFSHWSDI